jgi:hypothetical protein
VGAAFDDLVVADDENLVGAADGAEPMGDDEAGAIGHETFEGVSRWRYRRWQGQVSAGSVNGIAIPNRNLFSFFYSRFTRTFL